MAGRVAQLTVSDSSAHRIVGSRQRSLPPPLRAREDSTLRQRLAEEYADCSALFQRGLQQLNEVAAVLYNLRAEQEAISAAVSHENEKGDLLMNILGSLLQEISARGRQDLPTSRGFLSALERAADLYAREQAAAPRPAHAESAAIPAGATSSSPSGELTMSTYDSPGRTADSDASLADSVPSSVGPSVLLPLDASLPQSPPTQVQRHTFISRHVGSGMQFLPAYGAVAGHAGIAGMGPPSADTNAPSHAERRVRYADAALALPAATTRQHAVYERMYDDKPARSMTSGEAALAFQSSLRGSSPGRPVPVTERAPSLARGREAPITSAPGARSRSKSPYHPRSPTPVNSSHEDLLAVTHAAPRASARETQQLALRLRPLRSLSPQKPSARRRSRPSAVVSYDQHGRRTVSRSPTKATLDSHVAQDTTTIHNQPRLKKRAQPVRIQADHDASKDISVEDLIRRASVTLARIMDPSPARKVPAGPDAPVRPPQPPPPPFPPATLLAPSAIRPPPPPPRAPDVQSSNHLPAAIEVAAAVLPPPGSVVSAAASMASRNSGPAFVADGMHANSAGSSPQAESQGARPFVDGVSGMRDADADSVLPDSASVASRSSRHVFSSVWDADGEAFTFNSLRTSNAVRALQIAK